MLITTNFVYKDEAIVKSRVLCLEAAIRLYGDNSYDYADIVIKGPWPPGEKSISTYSAGTAFCYAQGVLRKRWQAGEDAILRDTDVTLHYIIKVINGRWPEAEFTLLQSASHWDFYKKRYLPSGEYPRL